MKTSSRAVVLLAAVALVLSVPFPAQAYLGPGSVVSGMGAVIALAGAVLASLFGFIWFPVKRLIRSFRRRLGPRVQE
jgi:hypothetical protein